MMKLLTPWIVLPLALLLMAGVMYAAVCADCVRIYESTRAELDAIDAERIELEKRFCDLTAKHEPQAVEVFSPENRNFQAMIERYRARTPTDSSAATPEVRHYRDAAAGVIRRWEAVDADYRRAETELREYLRSPRGSLAKQYVPALQTARP